MQESLPELSLSSVNSEFQYARPSRLKVLVELYEWQEVELVLLSEKEKLRSALGDLLVDSDETTDEEIDETALLLEIEAGVRGQSPLSQSIIDERNAGPYYRVCS